MKWWDTDQHSAARLLLLLLSAPATALMMLW